MYIKQKNTVIILIIKSVVLMRKTAANFAMKIQLFVNLVLGVIISFVNTNTIKTIKLIKLL